MPTAEYYLGWGPYYPDLHWWDADGRQPEPEQHEGGEAVDENAMQIEQPAGEDVERPGGDEEVQVQHGDADL